MRRSGLTEKKLRDRRFRRTEEAILKVFFEEDVYIGIDSLAKRIGVARSTVYHHHKKMREIVPDYRKYFLRNYKRGISKILSKKDLRINTLYEYIAYFLLRYKMEFTVLLKGKDHETLVQIMSIIRNKIESAMRLPKNSDKIYSIYASEVVELIRDWAVKGFSEQEIVKLVSDIMYLTTTMRERLMPINK